MRTNRATAPDNLGVLLEKLLREFTVVEVSEELGISYKHARAVIDFGVAEDKIRVLKHPQDAGSTFALYENPRWRREWITKPWRL